MKKLLVLSLLAVSLAACGKETKPAVVEQPQPVVKEAAQEPAKPANLSRDKEGQKIHKKFEGTKVPEKK